MPTKFQRMRIAAEGASTNVYVQQSRAPVAPTNYVFTNADALTVFNRDNSVAPNDTMKALLDNTVTLLQSDGTWAKLDVLQMYAGATQSASSINLKTTQFTAAPIAGTPVHVSYRGWYTNGLNDRFGTGFNPTTAGINYTRNNAMFGAMFRRSGTSMGSQLGYANAADGRSSINPRTTTNIAGTRINSLTPDLSITGVTDGFSFVVVDRDSATASRTYRNGVVGSTTTANSELLTNQMFEFGYENTVFTEGQYCCFVAGGSLSAAQHTTLNTAINNWMNVVGVAPIVSTARTLPSATTTNLPDGSAPFAAGQGMGCTGLFRRLDGKWYVGNGLATATSLLFSRLPSDFGPVEAEFTVSSLGLASPPGNGSIQGLGPDYNNPNLMWCVLKIGNAGATTYLFSFNTLTETVVQQPVALPTLSCNGVADDGLLVNGLETLLISRDASPSAGTVIRVFKATGLDTTRMLLTTPGDTDMLFVVRTASANFLAGDLLLTAGANGVNGTVSVYRQVDYGGYTRIRVDTITGADAIEGVVLVDNTYYFCNDSSTHPGVIVRNRIITVTANP